jgi:phosphoribosylamine-glycine ligase
MGEKADEARAAGLFVVGGGTFADRLEKDRSYGQDIARSAGAQLPEYEEFASIAEAMAHAKAGKVKGEVFFKTDRYLDSDATHKAEDGDDLTDYLTELTTRYGSRGRCILQECIEGVAISTALWWDGRMFCSPYLGTIEHKKFLSGDLGPATGCSFNATWWYGGTPQIGADLGMERLAPLFMREQAPPGIYDINAMVDGQGRSWFLEWTPRFGYDSEMTAQLLIPDLGAFLWRVASGQGDPDYSTDLAYSVRLSVPPYPWEHSENSDKRTAVGTRIRGDLSNFLPYLVREGKLGLEVASPEAIVGLVAAAGPDLSVLHEECMDAAKAIKVSGLQYRDDGEEMIMDDAQALIDSGIGDLPPGLLD